MQTKFIVLGLLLAGCCSTQTIAPVLNVQVNHQPLALDAQTGLDRSVEVLLASVLDRAEDGLLTPADIYLALVDSIEDGLIKGGLADVEDEETEFRLRTLQHNVHMLMISALRLSGLSDRIILDDDVRVATVALAMARTFVDGAMAAISDGLVTVGEVFAVVAVSARAGFVASLLSPPETLTVDLRPMLLALADVIGASVTKALDSTGASGIQLFRVDQPVELSSIAWRLDQFCESFGCEE